MNLPRRETSRLGKSRPAESRTYGRLWKLVTAGTAIAATTAVIPAATATAAATTWRAVRGEAITAINRARTAGLEGNLRFLATLGTDGIEHFAARGAEAATASTESAAITAAAESTAVSTAASAVAKAASTATVTGRTTVLATVAAAPGLVGETFGGVELLLTGRERERRLAIYTG